MSATDPAMSNLMGGRLVQAPGAIKPADDSLPIDTLLTHDLSSAAKRTLLTGFALNGLAAVNGLNVSTADIAKKAVEFADAVLRELDKKK